MEHVNGAAWINSTLMEWDPQDAAHVLLWRGFSSPASSGGGRCDCLSCRCRNYHMGVTVWGAQLGFCVRVCEERIEEAASAGWDVKQWWCLKWATRSLWVKVLQPHTLASNDYCQIDHFKVPNMGLASSHHALSKKKWIKTRCNILQCLIFNAVSRVQFLFFCFFF